MAKSTLLFLALIILTNAHKPKCPCSDPSLCDVRSVPLTRKEFFIFKWHNNDLWKNYNWTTVTTIGAFNSQPDPQLICTAHSHNVRVVPEADKFPMDQLRNQTARKLWVTSQMRKTIDGFYDGINVDLEAQLSKEDGPLLTSLVKELARQLKSINRFYQISFDLAWSPDCIDGRCYDYVGLNKVVDVLFVMAYDMRSQIFGPCVASANTPSDLARKGVQKYVDLGIPKGKLILGLPWYGYDYPCLNTPSNSSDCQIKEVPFRGVNCSDAAGTQRDFSILSNWQKTKSINGRQWDDQLKSPWFNYVAEDKSIHQVWYDDPQSLKIKVDWAKQMGLRGVGMWHADCVYLGSEHDAMWNTMGSFFQ